MRICRIGSAMAIGLALSCSLPVLADLPVKDPTSAGFVDQHIVSRVRNKISQLEIQQAVQKEGTDKGLLVDFNQVETLQDGTTFDPSKLYGAVFVGPYPFENAEADYRYKRFRRVSGIADGVALLRINDLATRYNSEDDATGSSEWATSGRVAVRLDLHLMEDGIDKHLGTYDTFVNFEKSGEIYVKAPSIYEGPFLNMVRSDDPSTAVISLRTDVPVAARVIVDGVGSFGDETKRMVHEIQIRGLEPASNYSYAVELENGYRTKEWAFKSAPLKGEGSVSFGYAGDSREGIGGGERTMMGVNMQIMEKEANLAFLKGADFWAQGGDLINGYSTSVDDFRYQLQAWKQAMAGFGASHAIFPAMGNHETLLRFFAHPETGEYVTLDRWPYDTESAEAVFADEFVNPSNGPQPSNPRRPSYDENLFSYQAGPLLMIAFNNNYWFTDRNRVELWGGAPEGWIFPDQLEWIARELAKAETDSTIKYVVLYAQEPIFPNGGHTHDAMWYHGNNNKRAWTYDAANDVLIPESEGIIEMRNNFARVVAASSKVAAVLTSDEHNYSKVLISDQVPAGVPAIDDTNANDVVCEDGESCSPIPGLVHPVWYFTCGGAGAPYYTRSHTPWNDYWDENAASCPAGSTSCFSLTSQYNFFLVNATQDAISLEVWSASGELVERIDDLMDVKNGVVSPGQLIGYNSQPLVVK